jgi:hypothetical protein
MWDFDTVDLILKASEFGDLAPVYFSFFAETMIELGII